MRRMHHRSRFQYCSHLVSVRGRLLRRHCQRSCSETNLGAVIQRCLVWLVLSLTLTCRSPCGVSTVAPFVRIVLKELLAVSCTLSCQIPNGHSVFSFEPPQASHGLKYVLESGFFVVSLLSVSCAEACRASSVGTSIPSVPRPHRCTGRWSHSV